MYFRICRSDCVGSSIQSGCHFEVTVDISTLNKYGQKYVPLGA